MDADRGVGTGGAWRVPVVTTVLVLLGLVVGAGAAWLALPHPERTPDAGACARYRTVQVTAAPQVYLAVVDALDELTPACVRVDASSQPGTAVAEGVSLGGSLPDLWIPEAYFLTTQAYLGPSAHPRVLSPSVARTPVLLVGGAAAPRFPSWAEAESSGLVTLSDPKESAVSALAAVAPIAEAPRTGLTRADAQRVLVPLAQGQGARVADGKDRAIGPAMFARSSRRLVVTTGQDLRELVGRGDVRDLTPASGVLELDFPLVVSRDAAPGTRGLARAIVERLASARGRTILATHSLQPPGSSARVLRSPSGKAISSAVFSWRTLAVPSSMLAVVDVSGSMDLDAGGRTRMDLLAEAAGVGLGFLPEHARVGLWVFSIDRGGPGRDWRELEPIRRLDDLRFGRTQRYALRERAAELPGLTGGGTGLYDTALAAYREAARSYRPHYSNAVVLMTDGRNDDPGSIGLEPLLERLAEIRDPQRPVRLVSIAISGDADIAALRRISRVTGGEAYVAAQPQDVLEVFARAVLSR